MITSADAALNAHQLLLNSPPPSKTTVTALKNWFFSAGTTPTGERIPHLWGASQNIYSDPHDLVALRVPADHDRLSQFIQSNLGILFSTRTHSQSPSEAPDERLISHSALSAFSTLVSLNLASVLLFGAIISLSVLREKSTLLGMLCFWTVLFAASVGLLTNAKRDQIFAATAAYAAVLVVFVSGNLGGATETPVGRTGARNGCGGSPAQG